MGPVESSIVVAMVGVTDAGVVGEGVADLLLDYMVDAAVVAAGAVAASCIHPVDLGPTKGAWNCTAPKDEVDNIAAAAAANCIVVVAA